jgi:hypothetical protein
MIYRTDPFGSNERGQGKEKEMKRLYEISGAGRKYFARLAGVALIVMGLLLVGCAAMTHMQGDAFKASNDVKKNFESYQVNPAYNYYYSGPDAAPIAILGVKKELRLEPADLWKTVDTPAMLKDLVTGMEYRLRGLNQYAWGFDIFNRQNKQIGIWYSVPIATTSVYEKDDGSVIIYTPDMETYIKMERGR